MTCHSVNSVLMMFYLDSVQVYFSFSGNRIYFRVLENCYQSALVKIIRNMNALMNPFVSLHVWCVTAYRVVGYTTLVIVYP